MLATVARKDLTKCARAYARTRVFGFFSRRLFRQISAFPLKRRLRRGFLSRRLSKGCSRHSKALLLLRCRSNGSGVWRFRKSHAFFFYFFRFSFSAITFPRPPGSPKDPLDASWELLGASWGALGLPWVALGVLLGPLGVLLGRLGSLLGCSWNALVA